MTTAVSFEGRNRVWINVNDKTGEFESVRIDATNLPGGLQVTITNGANQEKIVINAPRDHIVTRNIMPGKRVQASKRPNAPKPYDRDKWIPPTGTKIQIRGVE